MKRLLREPVFSGAPTVYDAQMGEHWWLLVVGAGMWAVIIATVKFGKNDPNDCQRCGHDDSSGEACREVVDANGWSSGPCKCADDYHWVM